MDCRPHRRLKHPLQPRERPTSDSSSATAPTKTWRQREKEQEAALLPSLRALVISGDITIADTRNGRAEFTDRKREKKNDDDALLSLLRDLFRRREITVTDSGRVKFRGRKTENKSGAGETSVRRDTPNDSDTNNNASPPRKRSTPIAIELPDRNAPVAYTPLTGRGDLVGGYFPNHDEGSFKPPPVTPPNQRSRASTPGSPSNMSAASNQSSPGSDVTPLGPRSGLSPIARNDSPSFPLTDGLGVPLGKYYPSNYMPPVTAPAAMPRVAVSAPPTYLAIPQVAGSKTNKSPGHERNASDVKRKLQQYQRDMIAQARMGSTSSAPGSLTMPKPAGPKLAPCGSPGPITPLELEESDNYLTAGARAKGNSPIGTDLEKQRQLSPAGIGTENQSPRTADPLGMLH